jgi:hypothetical protein
VGEERIDGIVVIEQEHILDAREAVEAVIDACIDGVATATGGV